MRNGKNYLIVFCTLLRKAVEKGFVHPAHIHAVSDDFMRRIENITDMYDLTRLTELMIRRYCALVKEFSLRDYSPLIRNVINHIDFNLREPLSVQFLAKQFKVSPSNLSAQFRREKGMPLTDFINAKRLERAKSMLHGSGLHVQEIADQCGFLDTNYFSRIFKRHFGVSPKEFRSNPLEYSHIRQAAQAIPHAAPSSPPDLASPSSSHLLSLPARTVCAAGLLPPHANRAAMMHANR
ncbi:MAG: helix-turn-helix domain-containing protein [Treponema sp.]|jgi:AraC-like DNA-binding protein|nr:helix-turn-helix domain-containing protein [Treponema sp.]